MTIKRQWMLALIFSAILSVIINSFVLSVLINDYFVDSTKKNYEHHYEQLVDFAGKALSESYSSRQLIMQLEAHLSDPIIGIKLYDANGVLLAEVNNKTNMMRNMMNNHMMNRMMGAPAQEIDSAEISDGKVLLGQLIIIRYGSIGNSLQTRMFTVSLMKSSILSFGFAVILILIIGSVISKKMSRDLMNTAVMATNIDLGNEIDSEQSKVREIRIIQQSLKTLQSKLKLKQVSRKRLLDEMVHQTRTPLTILKTHLEGFEDGILNMEREEIKTCEVQIENLTSIIANMSAMIDTDKDTENVRVEEIEVNQLLKRIVGALKVQFNKKQIALSLLSNKKIIIKTDQYKLSQCIYNILTNSYKFTEPNGAVSVLYEARGDQLTIVIEDSGSGINEEDREHLFDAYFRGTNTGNIPGEGMGLYIVKENLSRIKGNIRVESEVGKGSKFMITIPMNDPY